jgi:transposase
VTCITKQTVGKHQYLYESTSFRDDFGRPRNTKKCIGKIDIVTGEPKYTAEYLEAHPELKSATDILHDREAILNGISTLDNVQDYGVSYFLQNISNNIGLLDVLQESFPTMWREIFTIASYLVAADKPLMYCEDWLDDNYWMEAINLSSQRISEFFMKFGFRERIDFFRKWSKLISERECFALDITSVSSYSKQISDCEWGHNRDNEKLPQINLCLLLGEKSRLPVFQTYYSGSLSDVVTLEATLNEFIGVVGKKRITVIMDKGFYSQKNVNMLIEKDVKFLVGVPFSNAFAKQIVLEESENIESIDNAIKTSGAPIRGVKQILKWGAEETDLHIFAFFDAVKALKERNELYDDVLKAQDIAKHDPYNKEYKDDIDKYLIVKPNNNSSKKSYDVKIRNDVVEEELLTAGWFILMSNYYKKSQKVLDRYRMKDVVEKGFCKYKNNIGLKRLRVHNDKRAQNKEFITFIALIMYATIHNVMKKEDLYKTMTVDKLLLTLAKLKTSRIANNRILRPLTKEQKMIFKKFGIKPPTKFIPM